MGKDIKKMLSSLDALRKRVERQRVTINKATKELDDLTAKLLKSNQTSLKTYCLR